MSTPSSEPHDELGYGERMRDALPALHRGFLRVNRYFAARALRAGMGTLFSTPIGGYLMLLRTMGHTTGRMREAPLGYVIVDGAVYCIAGFGRETHWFRNIEADPHVEVVLPGRAFSGIAEEVTDPVEYLSKMRSLLVALGIVGRETLGCDPRTASDDLLRERTRGLPLVRIRVTGLAAGPSDPGGLAWVPVQVAALWLSWRALRWIGGRCRRCCRRCRPARSACPCR
jgi:deazaflavin-dependent oxidoreductase (nitroreductase family)